jgi:predicted Zn-dependent protease
MMEPVPGVLKDGGIDHAVTVHFQSGNILIYFSDKRPMLIWDKGKVRVEYERAGSRLIHQPSGAELALNNAYAHNYLTAQKSTPVKPGRRLTPSHAFFIAIVCGFITLCIVAYIYLVPLLASAAVKAFPVSAEIELGEQLSRQYINESEKDSSTFYATRFFAQMHVPSEYPVRVHVIKSDELNAFAVPGGNIFIYTGLLKKLHNASELQALLSHELTHVTGRHSLRSILRQATSGIVISAFFGDIGGITQWLISRADDLKQLDYSRELETEADTKGFQLMIDHGMNPSAMLSLLEVLQSQAQAQPSMMKYLSTHPETEARKTNVRQLIQRYGSHHKTNSEAEDTFAKLKTLCR